MTPFTESTLEQAALEWLQSLGYDYAFGPEIAPDGGRPERGESAGSPAAEVDAG